MKELFRKHQFIIVFSILGAAGGFLYWKFVGCQSGTCPIKSVWYMSTIWGLLFGYLSGSILKDLLVSVRKKKNMGDNNEGSQE
jgi:hypothetical protein